MQSQSHFFFAILVLFSATLGVFCAPSDLPPPTPRSTDDLASPTEESGLFAFIGNQHTRRPRPSRSPRPTDDAQSSTELPFIAGLGHSEPPRTSDESPKATDELPVITIAPNAAESRPPRPWPTGGVLTGAPPSGTPEYVEFGHSRPPRPSGESSRPRPTGDFFPTGAQPSGTPEYVEFGNSRQPRPSGEPPRPRPTGDFLQSEAPPSGTPEFEEFNHSRPPRPTGNVPPHPTPTAQN